MYGKSSIAGGSAAAALPYTGLNVIGIVLIALTVIAVGTALLRLVRSA